MTNDEEPKRAPDERGEASPTRRTFVKHGLALGAGLIGTGCLAGAERAPVREVTSSTTPGAGLAPANGLGSTRRRAGPLREDPFELQVEGRTVPGIVWRPPNAGADTPLVLAGHGGGFGTAGHKRVDRILRLATELGRYGIATAAIDQPGCGDRPGAEQEQARRRTLTIDEAIASLWTAELVEEMARDWQGSLDFLLTAWSLGSAGVGYWGLSGGTTFGLPLVALEPRISAAVLGLNSDVPLMRAYAPEVTCPVLYTMNLEDNFMSREACLALFDILPTQDKFVLAYPGDHGENLEPATREWARFFADRLAAPAGGTIAPIECDRAPSA